MHSALPDFSTLSDDELIAYRSDLEFQLDVTLAFRNALIREQGARRRKKRVADSMVASVSGGSGGGKTH